jgi:2-dehydro-3-deoxyglucarate aldolase
MEQRNTFRASIEDGAAVFGARSATFSPNVVEIYGELGLDYVWLDFEHTGPSPYDSTLFEDLTRAAEIGGTELLVRLPSGEPHLIRKTLDAGVRNLLIPRVDTAEEVRRAVEATRFVYQSNPGERGRAGSRSSTWGNATEYVDTEDESVCLGVMIEKATALENLDEILSVPDLGFVIMGPSDLSVQLGHPNDKSHPDVTEALEEIRSSCQSAGVPVGQNIHDADGASEAVERGEQIIRIGGELGAAQEVIGNRLTQLRDRQED